jgi:hypothetical protein
MPFDRFSLHSGIGGVVSVAFNSLVLRETEQFYQEAQGDTSAKQADWFAASPERFYSWTKPLVVSSQLAKQGNRTLVGDSKRLCPWKSKKRQL